MSAAREEILGRVRSALGDTHAGPAPERAYRRHGTLERPQLADLLARRIAEYRATVHRAGRDVVRMRVEEVCAARGVHRLGVPAGLAGEWRPGSVEIVADTGLGPNDLDRLDGVLTGCTLAIAETGTLVLTGGDGRRALTLVPDLHICVVAEEQIVELVPEAIERLHGTRPVTFVSGPSATSDIELSRVEGVHGPRTLDVVLVR